MTESMRDSELGAAMVEMAVVLPVFLLILIISMDFLRLSYHSLTTQYVVNRVVRQAVVGPSARPAAYSSQEEWIQGATIALSRSLGVAVSADQIAVCPYSSVAGGGSCDPTADDAGQPGELIAVQVLAPTSGFGWSTANHLDLRNYALSAQVLGRNEPWSG